MMHQKWNRQEERLNVKSLFYGDNYHDEFVMEDPFSLELQLDTIVNLLLGTTK